MNGGDRLRVTLLDRMSTVENFQPPIASPSPARNNTDRSLFNVMSRDRRHGKTTWKFLRDKLLLKRTSSTWISSNLSFGFLLSSSDTNRSSDVAEEGRSRVGTVLVEERAMSVQPPRMSLMELLEDRDGQMYDVDEREEVDERGGGETVVAAVTTELGCCVCMIRSKGAAFIPCGHTFCRLCSRELWMQRGICPLCNTYILQVLDIF